MKSITILVFILFSAVVFSQTQTENYIKSTTYKVESTVKIPNPTISQVNQNITYFDGLGRSIQQIAHKQSATGKDIVIPIQYDSFGRQAREYLPYVPATAASLDYKTNALTDVGSFYDIPAYDKTTNPYSQKEFEASPLDRVLKQAAPGNDWKSGNGHEIKFEYQTNSGSGANEDKVKNFGVDLSNLNTTNTVKLVNNGYYIANDLYKTIIYDENTAAVPLEISGSTVEFKNKQGQVVLKRTYGASGQGITIERHDTYYVYDDLGNLTFVIPPKASDIIFSNTSNQTDITSVETVSLGNSVSLSASNSIRLLPGFNAKAGSTFTARIEIGNETILDNLCYQYRYDSRHRLIEKKLPGKQWEFIVYDKLDRVVATGPANSPFNNLTSAGWLITKYDAFNRPVITGWMPAASLTPADRKSIQAARNSETTNFSETKTASVITTINNVDTRYTNLVWPTNSATAVPATVYHVLTVNYYDNYDYPAAPTVFTAVAGQPVFYNTTVKPVGLPTGSWTRIPEAITTTPIKAEIGYVLYDTKARPIRNYISNFLGGYEQIDTNLDFAGKTMYTITTHQRIGGAAVNTIKDEYSYSNQDRLISVKQTITGVSQQLLAYNEYDELGQLISKKVGNNENTPLQVVNYSYNIRGWLKGINKVDLLTNGADPKDLFAFELKYNDIADVSKKLFNGNISQTRWASDNMDKTIRNYMYTYDALNRLKSATDNAGLFNEDNIQYDKNGNILKLKRKGAIVAMPSIAVPANYGLMDDLTYTYDSGNKLLKVADAAATDQYGFKDDAVNTAADTADDYTYDANGNMLTDANKGLTTNIVYNHLNLPTKIIFPTGNITYLYNAAGQKVQKIVVETSPANTITTEYLNGFQYKKMNSGTTELQFFPIQEGYVANNSGTLSYVFQYKDHLGNVRLSYAKNPSSGLIDIIEENNYYPFGLEHQGYNNTPKFTYGNTIAEQYKYNGKELQDEMGLGWYDYQARNYDPAIGRWMNIDPLAEKSRRFSPYTYALNNPVYFIDPDGMMATPPDWYIDDRTGKVLGQDGATTNNVRLIDSNNYNDIKEANGGSTMSAEATAQLQNSETSTLVTVNDTQIQNELQQVNDQSRNVEHQTNIVLDRTSGEVKAVRGNPGVDGLTTMDYETRTNKDGVSYNTQGGNLLLGQAHGHNLIKDPNKVNIPGTSEVDKNTAASSGVTIYSIDAYNTLVGGQAQINRVTPAGVQDNGVGTTKGATGTGNFNIGLDALKRWSGF
ncbi:DUF6443 domain-containing protein [Flavobacterium sp. ENC]|uniref:DUF6443 domain-containing protein n=1 Tax=Flavobacterium sp. ENC TaxID=2897330 RepID=UPI001E30B281|nr:DUF6443 domain-containing protein [Flavobacterium sp. ENC]MCD0467673.1 RHS repeat-associated core domain-containing protein [Flavobacterium sp. ENC]